MSMTEYASVEHEADAEDSRRDADTDDELLSIIQSELEDAIGYDNDGIVERRSRNLQQYLGQAQGDERDGRSQVLDRSVLETVEALMPYLHRLAITDGVARFEPVGDGDEEIADQATSVVDHILSKQNDGHRIMSTFIKDGLISDVGVLKWYYDESVETKIESLSGLTDDELARLDMDVEADVMEHTAYPDPQGAMMPPLDPMGQPMMDMSGMAAMQPAMLHDIRRKVRKPKNKICIENVAPEQFVIDGMATSPTLEDCRFIGHRVYKTKSQLIAMGFDREAVDKLPFGNSNYSLNQDYLERYESSEYDADINGGAGAPSNQRVEVLDAYVRADLDGDGVGEIHHVICAGFHSQIQLLYAEEVDRIPFACWSPVLLPYRVIGLGIASLASESQQVLTALQRSVLDATYQAVSPRLAVLDTAVNLDDLSTSEPGAIIRTKEMNSIQPIGTPMVGTQALPVLDYMASLRAARTGVSLDGMGVDPTTLRNETATAAALRFDASTARTEMVARNLAELGIKPLFRGLLETFSDNFDGEFVFRLRDKVVRVDPAAMAADMDVTVSVGLAGHRDKQQALFQGIMAIQERVLTTAGVDNPLVGFEELYNTMSEMLRVGGVTSAGRYFKDPAGAPPPPPPQPDPNLELIKAQVQIEREKLELQREKLAFEAEVDSVKMGAELQAAANAKAGELELREREVALKEREAAWRFEIENEKLRIQAAKL